MPPSWAPGEYGHGVPRRIIRAVGPCWARSGAGRVSRREGLPFVHGRPGPSCGGRDDPQRARHAVPNGARTRSPIRARSAPWRHRLQAPLGLLLLHGVLRARGGQQGLAASVGGVPSASTTGPEPGTKRLGERQEARAAQLLPAPPEAMAADTHADFAGGEHSTANRVGQSRTALASIIRHGFRCVRITPLGSPVVPACVRPCDEILCRVDRDLWRLAAGLKQPRCWLPCHGVASRSPEVLSHAAARAGVRADRPWAAVAHPSVTTLLWTGRDPTPPHPVALEPEMLGGAFRLNGVCAAASASMRQRRYGSVGLLGRCRLSSNPIAGSIGSPLPHLPRCDTAAARGSAPGPGRP
jgi:hypothetical protein